ncbi:14491_t:CDS:2, partial [Cetraspora pellucida]
NEQVFMKRQRGPEINEIIETPIYREVLAYYDEQLNEIQEVEKEVNNIASLYNTSSEALKRINFKKIETAILLIEEIDKEIDERKEIVGLIIRIRRLPIELISSSDIKDLTLVKWYHLLHNEKTGIKNLVKDINAMNDYGEIVNNKSTRKQKRKYVNPFVSNNVSEQQVITIKKEILKNTPKELLIT